MKDNHRVCLSLPRVKQAVKNWRRSLDNELFRAQHLSTKRLPLKTWERVAIAASTLAHYGRCVQIQSEPKETQQ